MALDGKLLARAREKLGGIRSGNQEEQQRRQDRIYRTLPEIKSIDDRLRRQMIELVGLTIRKAPDMNESIAELEKESLSLQKRREELLKGNGYPADYLEDIYSCKVCRDTGYVNGEPCSCLMALYNRELTDELGVLLKTGAERFESFNLSYYDAEPDTVTGISPRSNMRFVFDTCREYAANFSKRSLNFLFQGGTGLGKTFLSACIARVVADKGFSVCYDTASAALEAFELRKFAKDPETAEQASVKVERMLGCDLMILDDLGTEMTTSMSVSALYTLINTRLINGKKTIISTNLTDGDIERRYSRQICSRLDGEFTKLPFVGRDIRKQKSI